MLAWRIKKTTTTKQFSLLKLVVDLFPKQEFYHLFILKLKETFKYKDVHINLLNVL